MLGLLALLLVIPVSGTAQPKPEIPATSRSFHTALAKASLFPSAGLQAKLPTTVCRQLDYILPSCLWVTNTLVQYKPSYGCQQGLGVASEVLAALVEATAGEQLAGFTEEAVQKGLLPVTQFCRVLQQPPVDCMVICLRSSAAAGLCLLATAAGLPAGSASVNRESPGLGDEQNLCGCIAEAVSSGRGSTETVWISTDQAARAYPAHVINA